MKPSHPKYKIRKTDTIAVITELFGVSEDSWKMYHNNMCRLENVIKDILPKHLEEIFLLPKLWGKEDELNIHGSLKMEEYNENKPIILHNRNILFFTPININNKYGVVLHLSKNKIHYEIECKYLKEITDNVFQVLLDRKQVYINNQEPDLKLYELADDMSKAIYPLILNINREKKIVAIENHNDIVIRAKKAQEKLSQYYVGEYAEKYFDIFEKQYTNPNYLINNIEQELFYQLFFLPIQGLYSDGYVKKIQYKHTSKINDTIKYSLNIQLKSVYTHSGKIVARIDSDEMIDSKKCFQAEYLLYPEDHSVFTMRGNLILKDKKNEPQEIGFEIYHLNKEERVIKRKILKI